MLISKDKIAALVAFAIVEVTAPLYFRSVGMPDMGFFVAFVFAVFGLALVWFAEPLGEIACFSRGIAHTTPPVMIEAMGWILLIGYPLLLACILRWPGVLGI